MNPLCLFQLTIFLLPSYNAWRLGWHSSASTDRYSHWRIQMLKQLTGIIVCLLTLLASLASAKENILYSFQGGADGSSPHAGLAHDRLGNLYGTTSKGGAGMCFGLGCGTVYMLTRG